MVTFAGMITIECRVDFSMWLLMTHRSARASSNMGGEGGLYVGGEGVGGNLTRNTCSFPVQPRETFVILLGGTQIAAGAGGCGLLLQEDYSSVRRTKC